MLENILQDSKKQLTAALKHKKHPFRFFTLATLQKEGGPNLRTVVLRDFDPDQFLFTLFTDKRSKKVQQLEENPKATGLFYDSNRYIQLVVELEMIEITEDTSQFNNLPEPSKKDYTSTLIPGSPLISPQLVKHDFTRPNFTLIRLKGKSFEYLKLKRPNHIRAYFSSVNNWNGVFLAP